MEKFYDMEVYKLAEELSELIWQAAERWPEKARATMGPQMIVAADNIAAKLAEGYGRFTPAERRLSFLTARGAFEETKVWVRKAIHRKLLSKEQVDQFIDVIGKLGPRLNSFIKNSQ